MNKMLICLLVSQNIVISDTGERDRMCEYQCQKDNKETVYTHPIFQCPTRLYIDDTE